MLKIGSIGIGGRGHMAKQAHRPDEGSKLVAACDRNPQALDKVKEDIDKDIYVTDDYKKMLDENELDAVFVTTPDFLHEEHAVEVLKRGIAVYLEKPMAITIEGCDRIMRTAKENNAKLYVGHNMRFFPVIQKMKQLIDDGRIGEVQAVWCRHFISNGGDYYFKDWHSEQKYSTGLLLQKGAHDIDIIHYLAGSHTKRTVGMGKLSVYNRVKDRRSADEYGDATVHKDVWPPLTQTQMSPVIDVEDHSMILLQLENGVQASYEHCHYSPDSWRNYTVIGTEGRIENQGDHSSDASWAYVTVWDKRCGYHPQGTENIAVPPVEGSHGGADPQIIDDFLNYVRTGERKGAQPIDARMSVAAGCLATKSLREGNMPFDIPKAQE